VQNRASESGLAEGEIGLDFPEDGERQFVLAGGQRTQSAEVDGQHVENLHAKNAFLIIIGGLIKLRFSYRLDKISSGGSLAHFLVQSSVFGQEVGHVGNVDADLEALLAVKFSEGHGVVQVSGRGGINRENALLSEKKFQLSTKMSDDN